MHAKTRESQFLIFTLLAFSFISISCGKGSDTGQQTPKVDTAAATSNDIVMKDKIDNTQNDDSSDAKLTEFAKAFNLDDKKTIAAARDARFDPNSFNGKKPEDMAALFTFFANADPTFAKFFEFLFSNDLTFNGRVTADKNATNNTATALTSFAASRFDATNKEAIAIPTPVRSSFMAMYAFTILPKDKTGLPIFSATLEFMPAVAEAVRRYAFTATYSMGINGSIDFNLDGAAFVDPQVAFFKQLYEGQFGFKDLKIADNTLVENTWNEIEPNLRRFFSSGYAWMIDGKAFSPTVEREKDKITVNFIQVNATIAPADLNQRYQTQDRK